MRFIFTSIAVLLISFSSLAQKSLLLNFHLDGGFPLNSYGNNRSMLASKISSLNTQAGISLTARFWDRIGLTFGAAQNYMYWNMRDKAFEDRNPGYVVHLKNSNFYYSTFASLQLIQKLSSKTFLYIQGGISLNLIGAGKVTDNKVFVKGNEHITSTTLYNNENKSITGEIGIQKYIGQRHMICFGIKVNGGKEDIINGSYVSDNQTGNVYKDTYNSKGSYGGLTFKYSYVLAHTEKKVKQPKLPKHEEEPPIVKEEKPPVDTVQKQPARDTIIPKKVEGREVKILHKLNVKNRKITVKVWDHEQVDGDRISINVNGKWVLINYTLQKQQKVFEVELNDGPNYFVLHALNLGKYPPNTAAIIVDDGQHENQIILESTLETSGTIEITVDQK